MTQTLTHPVIEAVRTHVRTRTDEMRRIVGQDYDTFGTCVMAYQGILKLGGEVRVFEHPISAPGTWGTAVTVHIRRGYSSRAANPCTIRVKDDGTLFCSARGHRGGRCPGIDALCALEIMAGCRGAVDIQGQRP